jgi:WD40 repeat protein
LAQDYTAIFICISFISLYAMEKEIQPAKILAEITHLSEPQSVICIPHNKAIILAMDGCGLYDFSNKEIIKFHTYKDRVYHQTIIIHPDKTKFALTRKIFTSKKTDLPAINIDIYDLTTHNKMQEYILSPNNDIHATFNPFDTTLLLYDSDKIKAVDYTAAFTKDYILEPMCFNLANTGCIFHPTKSEMIFYGAGNAFIFAFDKELKQFTFKRKIPVPKDYTFSCQYSPDGAWITTNNFRGCSLVDPQDDTIYSLGEHEIDGMAFDPTSSMIATIKGKDLYYWNVTTKKLLLSMKLTESVNTISVCKYNFKPIGFSDDGTKLIFTGTGKCFVLEVPFEVLHKKIYPAGTKNKCSFSYLILQNHPEINMPEELKKLIIESLLKISELSEM